MEDENTSNAPPGPFPVDIFAKYAYQDASERKTRVGKRKVVNTDEDEFRGGSRLPIEQQNGETKLIKVEEGSTQTVQQQQGSKKVKLYHHLKEIDDHLEDGLDIVFCGIKWTSNSYTHSVSQFADELFSPGEQSSQIGHHYANPTNHFWSCLHASGLTSRKLDPREDYKLPKSFFIGLTNLVDRPSVEQSELSKAEQVAGVSKLLQKIWNFKPRIVCFVGLGIADVVRANCGLPKAPKTPKTKAEIGIQSYKMVHTETHAETLFFAVSSTSGRVVRYTKSDKIQQFTDLQALLQKVKKEEYDSSHLNSLPTPTISTSTTHLETC